ncbi:hypothetical protein EOM82_00205 [bacterium]|nr:hypothetical protein [bacterium]
MFKSRNKLFILVIMLLALMTTFLVACSNTPATDPDDDDYEKPAATITVNNAMDMIYNGLVQGGTSLNTTPTRYVETVYTLYTSAVNFTITYKACYKENTPDSLFYINVFDNKEYIERATFYYDSKDLYITSGEKKEVISNFSSTMMFNVFFAAVTSLDMTGNFYGGEIAKIFNRNNEDINLSLLMSANNVEYTKVANNRDSIEIIDVDLSIINDVVNASMDLYLNNIGNKFDILTNKYLDFNLSRLLESRLAYIFVDKINVQLTDSVATATKWKASGTMRDNSKYFVSADMNYDFTTTTIEDGSKFNKSKYNEASLGKNEFEGTILIPAISDKVFDMEVVTDLNTKNNALNKLTVRILDAQKNDFIGAYYRDQIMYLDTNGLYNWVGGTVDLAAMHLPKVYFDGIDFANLITAGYNDLLKAVLVFVDMEKGGIDVDNEELYDIIMENFSSDSDNNIYYTITEELIKKIRQDDKSIMTMLSELMKVDQTKLESYLGEDFFTDARLVISYNLDTGKIGITLYKGEELIFQAYLVRKDFSAIIFPADTTMDSFAYAELLLPSVTTLEYEAELRVGNAKSETDLSEFLGALIGDVSGKNTPHKLYSNERLYISGAVSESINVNAQGESVVNNTIKAEVYKKNTATNIITKLFNIYTNTANPKVMLVEYYLPIGNYLNNSGSGLKFKINKEVIKNAFNELLGDGNVFSEDSAFGILEMLLNTKNSYSTVTKSDGYINFSVMVDSTSDPVYNLLGIKDTTASVRARIRFVSIDLSAIVPANYYEPTVMALSNVTIESIYSDNSKWKDQVDVYFEGVKVTFKPNYTTESTTVVTGKNIYNPTAYLFGKEIAYRIEIIKTYGTYKIEGLLSNIITIDPAYTKDLPTKIAVQFDNGSIYDLNCSILDFNKDNITHAGYNLSGFAGVFNEDMLSTLKIGNNSIVEMSFPVYVLVHNRNIITQKDTYDGVPIVGTINIDPYTYALKKMENINYNPITQGIYSQEMYIYFNNVYGHETYVDGEIELERDLTYDTEGYNKYNLSSLNLSWEFDQSVITWRGGRGYAYTYYGDPVKGYAIRIAIEVNVMTQEVEYVKIDDEENGKYTIDYLIKATYTLPVQTRDNHIVKVYFKGTTQKARIIGIRPDGISDSEYYSNYLPVQLLWVGADSIKSKINVNGTATLFGSSNTTTATFGENIFVGVQTVTLSVVVPQRYMSDSDEVTQNVSDIVTRYYMEGNSLQSDRATLKISKAGFSAGEDKLFKPLEINPYDASAALPSNIYLEVNRSFGTNSEKIIKQYPVRWKTTNKIGDELNIIREKDGKFYLANPVTQFTKLAVYGTVGDGNGEIWVVMYIINLPSELQSVTYFCNYNYDPYNPGEGLPTQIYVEESHYINNIITKTTNSYNVAWTTTNMKGEELGIVYLGGQGRYLVNLGLVGRDVDLVVYGKGTNDLGENLWIVMNIVVSEANVQTITYLGLENNVDNIVIDPYKTYRLPSGFVAVLESGDEIVRKNITWEINNGIDENWYPALYSEGLGLDRAMYGSDNKYLFSFNGGIYYIRYIIGGDSDILRQELILEVNVPKRTIMPNLVEIYNDEDNMPVDGYIDIDYYSASSTNLLNRLLTLQNNIAPSNYVGVYFNEAKSEGIFDRFTLQVDWCDDSEGEPNYNYSLNKLIYMLRNPLPGFEMVLRGTIASGTINEQTLEIAFAFSNLEIEKISFSNVRKMAEGSSPAIELDQQNSIYQIDYSQMYDEIEEMNVLRVNILKVFGLTMPGQNNMEKYASPYQYINYLLSSIKLYYKNGNVADAEPVIDFLYFSENVFNNSVLGVTQQVGTISLTEIMLYKLSQGSAIDTMKVVITAKVDERLTSDLALTAELFNEDSTEKYGEEYPLPTFIEVNYRYSGTVRYDVSTWTVGSTSRSLLNTDYAEGIPVRLIDTLRLSGSSEGSFYNFYYRLPIEEADFFLQVYIPKKNINKTFYSANGETSLYDIVNGTINITNPYLYYVKDSEYGLNEKLIPTTITAEITAQNYSSTELNSHYVDWTFIPNVFTESIFRTGCNKVLFATAILKSYYDLTMRNDITYTGQTQIIELYIQVAPMEFYGINYQSMTVVEGVDESSNTRLNTITLDPYNDVMNYNGTMNLPVNGLNVYFNDFGDNYTFNGVVFRLIDDTGSARDIVNAITYDQFGHTLNYGYLNNPGRITLRMYIPGYDYDENISNSGILIYVVIFRRVIEDVVLPNIATDVDGNVSIVELPSLYYIDPYNSASYPLPTSASIKFEESSEFSTQNIVGWEFFDESEGTWITLNDSEVFYSLTSSINSNIQYGYFNNIEQAYYGGNYRLRGFIRVGSVAGGVVGQQPFEIIVIIINRSLISSYSISYAFSDPLGGRLGDIPNELNQAMFVNYDKYYMGLIDEQYYYSEFSVPVLPKISWSRYLSDDAISSKGGFDTDIDGYVSGRNTNTDYLYAYFRQQVNSEYDLLIKALMWDSYFNTDGSPLVNYSTQAAGKLIELAEELENEVIYSTFILLRNRLANSTDEVERENGSYLVNGLIVMMSELTGYNPTDYLDRLSVVLFGELQKEYQAWVSSGSKEAEKNKNIVIYIEWATIYAQFKDKDVKTTATLSDYQWLKVAKYDKLNSEGNNKFSSNDREYNTKLKAKISNSLIIYINKEIYIRLYDRVTLPERQRMSAILGQPTENAESISNALQTYLSIDWQTLSSYGELTHASISAPELTFEDIYNIDDSMTTEALTEFLFNIYDSNALDDRVLVEFIVSYEEYYRPYIEEAVAKAWDNYRNTVKDQSIDLLIAKIIRDTVNSIVPTYEDEYGTTYKINDFDYVDFSSNNSYNATYWTEIYEFRRDNAITHIENMVGTDEQKWNNLYTAHIISGEDDMVALMDMILAEIPSSVTDTYAAAFSTYKIRLSELATKEMDDIYSEAEKTANADILEAILVGSPIFSELAFDAKLSFSYMYGNLAVTAYDYFLNSYTGETYTEISTVSSSNFNNDKAYTLHYYLYSNDPSISTAIRARAQEIFFYVLQETAAFDYMYENAQKINLTKSRIDSYLSVLNANYVGDYNSVFGEEEFTDFKKAKYFLQMRKNYQGGTSYANYMTQWYKASLLEANNTAYNNLYAEYVRSDEDNQRNDAYKLHNIKIANTNINMDAFNRYVEVYRQKALIITSQYTDGKESYTQDNMYAMSQIIYDYLLASDFAYKDYLNVGDEVSFHKAAALSYYYNNVATAKQRAIIEYEIMFNSNDNSLAYDTLLTRSDVDKSFEDGLTNSYYYSVLTSMLDSVENDINENTIVSETDPQYVTFSTIISKMILAGCENVPQGIGTITKIAQSQLLATFAREDYLNYLYINAINRYTMSVDESKQVLAKAYYNNLYDSIYQANKQALDDILASIYADYVASGQMSIFEGIKYNAFNILSDTMVKLELNNLYNTIEALEKEIAFSKVYDDFDLFKLNNFAYDQYLWTVYTYLRDGYLDVYEGADTEEKAMLDNVINKALFEAIEAEDVELDEIIIIYNGLKINDGGEIQTLINEIISNWESISFGSENILDSKLISDIGLQTKQNLYIQYGSIDIGRINLFTVINVLNIIKNYKTALSNLDKSLFTIEFLSIGDEQNLDEEFKCKAIESLISVLTQNGFFIAVDLINGKATEYHYDFVISNIDASADYLYFEQKILSRLLKTSSAATIASLAAGGEVTVYGYYNYIYNIIVIGGGVVNPNNLGALPINYYLQFIDSVNPYSDVSYQKAFDAMGSERVVDLVFYVSDNIETAQGLETIQNRERRVLLLDKTKLINSNESSQIDSVYIANLSKTAAGNMFKKDGIVYKYVQMMITYVDYFNASTASTIEDYADKNKIIIDPLFPELPTKVQAYATFTETNAIRDVGMVNVTYSEEFYENNYAGGLGEYAITLTDSRGNTNSLIVSVSYKNRTISNLFSLDAYYGGNRVTIADVENSFFIGYYNLFSEVAGTNIMAINPINESILDTNGKKYMLPSTLGIKFSTGETAVYTNVVWDLSQISYTLAAQNDIPLRILSYEVVDAIYDTVTKVNFNYSGSGSVTISVLDSSGEVISSKEYENAPSFAIWNVKFRSINQSISSVDYYSGDDLVSLGEMENNVYISVLPTTMMLNPYDIIYPTRVSVNFGDGTAIEITPSWRLEPGNEGTYKLKDILLGVAQDRYIMAIFNYLGYTVRVRFLTEDIEIEDVDSDNGEYIDGGVLYLVVGAGGAYVQMQKNYSYMYYNFSKTANEQNWQKVPLSFMDVELNKISTTSPHIYEGENGIRGVLGWDKVNYPDINFSPNIRFSVIVIEPKLYAYMSGDSLNTYVINDFISTPYDSNYQKKKDVNEPNTIGNYFVQLGANRELDTYFTIVPEDIQYKIVDQKILFEVAYQMSATNTRLAFTKTGGRTITFEIGLKLTPYLYTKISNLKLMRTKDADQTGYWTWTTVPETSMYYTDAIHWPLGVTLKASELPKAVDQISGEVISLMWELDDVNINLASTEGYKVKGWYYDATSTWKYLELTIFVDKVDKKTAVLNSLGGNYALINYYNGRYYKLPLNVSHTLLSFLRTDGAFDYLPIESYIIEYRPSGVSEVSYSTTDYPLNAGVYDIRVSIQDYNVYIKDELVFTLTIRPVTIDSSAIVFVGDEQSITNIITHTYDSKNHPLVVYSGLPTVMVDNWFVSINEKEAMVNAYTAQGYSETAAKTRAYNDLYTRVTIATRTYLDGEIAKIRRDSGITDAAVLNATLFDRLEPNMSICEVVYSISYINQNDEVLANPPIDVGTYTVLFEVSAANNRGNYTFSTDRVSRIIKIEKPDITYSITSNNLVYSGRNQNPLINNLHNQEGELPSGVTVLYEYSYTENGQTKYATNGIMHVGSYYCDITIDGGINYPSMVLPTSVINIVPKDLYINLTDISMQYLSDVVDVKDYVTFTGLTGTDKPRDFGAVVAGTEVKYYYTLGIYSANIDGFMLYADSEDMYSYCDLSNTYQYDDKSYYKMVLKNASMDGSLYKEIDGEGNYVYIDLINKFRNYTVYVITAGVYEIKAEEDAVVIESDEELQTAISNVGENQSLKLYLTEGEYSAVTLNTNADISIIGCYDNDKNILTSINGITVNKGVLTIKIIKFLAQTDGAVSLSIGGAANSIGIYDCEFDGMDRAYSVAIKTSVNYRDKIYMVGSVIKYYQRGIELTNGNLELTDCQFAYNKSAGIAIQSKLLDLRITQTTFTNQDIALLCYSPNVTILYNTFDCNRIGIRIPSGDADNEILANNTFENTNGINVDHNF